jgi:hypothetical protein
MSSYLAGWLASVFVQYAHNPFSRHTRSRAPGSSRAERANAEKIKSGFAL